MSRDRAHDMTTLTSRSPTLPSLPVARRPRIARRELEFDEVALDMETRLALGASRIGQARAAAAATACALRDDQARVFADFATYLTDVATRPPAEQRPPFCRIILPPRTGKTVVAGHIIDRAELAATFIVPTRTLLEQTVRELARQLPGVAIGSYGGGHDHVIAHGVNVTTYAMLHAHAAALPVELRRAALVFVDEAHHAMTPARSTLLATAFDRLAVRVALTATPDYDAERRLERYFPDLVHEITLEEALALDLLAPLRAWVVEVDADASNVRFVAGDYESEGLGRLMSTAPFFRAVELFRYDPDNARRPCLIACGSRQQAYDLWRYLRRHRPAGTRRPALVLGDTPRAVRERVLARFEAGSIDTLIQVGVLIEGWSSPRCKLLLDLAPSTSRVRATQKYFRVMTRDGDTQARIVVLLPINLPAVPVLPIDLFGALPDFVHGRLIGAADGGGADALVEDARTPIAGVRLASRLVEIGTIARPALDPGSAADVRDVLTSCADFDPATCGLGTFVTLMFRHPQFTGRGDFLLRWLRVAITRASLDRLLTGLYPDAAADRIFAQYGERYVDASCSSDRQRLLHAFHAPSKTGLPEEPFATAWRAASGGCPDRGDSPETTRIARTQLDRVLSLLPRLTRRRRLVVLRYFGLFGRRPHTFVELAEQMRVSSGRIGQLLGRALRELRLWFAEAETAERLLSGPDAQMVADAADRRAAEIAAAEAARARHLDAVFADAERLWCEASERIDSRSSHDREAARDLLNDLLSAAAPGRPS
ncbi:MAG: DEAD/DEAH box helicase family protein, partial [Myxococcales bacterium]|nr:DEAD/DEAH box helicase family protein [Myxococcales bacterium]